MFATWLRLHVVIYWVSQVIYPVNTYDEVSNTINIVLALCFNTIELGAAFTTLSQTKLIKQIRTWDLGAISYLVLITHLFNAQAPILASIVSVQGILFFLFSNPRK